jgi:uracil-DNA glycosylase
MTQEHGEWFAGPSGKRLMATYHPAYILRLEGNDYHRVLNEAIEDFRMAVAEYRSLVASR